MARKNKFDAKIWIIPFAILAFSAVLLISFYKTDEKIKCADCNVILISIDTLRTDHLSAYGYYRNTSFNIDSFAKKGILFENVFSQAAWTLPSHASMLTGLYPRSVNTGITDEYTPLSNSAVTLAKVLKGKNYTTGAFITGVLVSSYFGFSQGFDYFDEIRPTGNSTYEEKQSNRIENTNKRVFDWLKNNNNRKFFLFLHYFDVHAPFSIPDSYLKMFYDYNGSLDLTKRSIVVLNKLNLSKDDVNWVISNYDGSIKYVDDNMEYLFQKLEDDGLMNKTIVIITADHGEGLNDHGFFGHGLNFGLVVNKNQPTLFDEVIHVPLIIKHPKLNPETVSTQVSLVDIVPTLLDFLDISGPKNLDGKSLVPIISGDETSDRVVFSETYPFASIRTKDSKLIYNLEMNKSFMFFDLLADPKEKVNKYQQPDFLYTIKQMENKIVSLIKETGEKSEMLNLTHKEISPKIISENEAVDMSVISLGPDLKIKDNWFTNGDFIDGIANKTGIAIMDPIVNEPIYLKQNIHLPPNNNYMVILESAIGELHQNAAYIGCICVSGRIKIKISDGNQEQTLYEGMLLGNESWKKVALDISDYAGKNVTFKVEGYRGGLCGIACFAPIFIDKFYIAKYSTGPSIEERLRGLGYVT